MSADKNKNFWDGGDTSWGNWGDLLSRAKKSGQSILSRAKASSKNTFSRAKKSGISTINSVKSTATQTVQKLPSTQNIMKSTVTKIPVKKIGVKARSISISQKSASSISKDSTPAQNRFTSRQNSTTKTRPTSKLQTLTKLQKNSPQPQTQLPARGLRQNRSAKNYNSTRRAAAKAAKSGAKNYQNLNNLHKSTKLQSTKLTKNLENLKNLAGETAVKSLNSFKSTQTTERSAMAQTWSGPASAAPTDAKLRRLGWLRWVVLAAVAIIGVRLFVIQIVEHDSWVAKAEEQHTMQNTILAERGEIYMLDGDEVAQVVMNETVYTLIIDPLLADQTKTTEIVDKIAKDQKIASWDEIFADKTRRYYVVARQLSRDQAQQIESANLDGLTLQKTTERVYPEGQLASAVLGFVNAEGEGQYGVEGNLDTELKGKNGLLKTIKDVNNVALSIGDDNIRVPAEDGKDIVLTIDRNIQRATEKILAERMSASGASHASAVIMNPQNGKIWAMANLPSYDPSKYTEVEDATLFQNNALEDAFEPASVCKTFTFATAIEEGAITPDTTYYNTGSTIVDEWTINNAYQGMYGEITMQTALNYSLNTGSTQALRLLGGSATTITQTGKDKLYDYYYNRFGFGQFTGIELYESPGIIVGARDLDGTDARYANMTFGQGMNITMAQVISAFASVVNGGNYYTPTLIEGEIVNGELIKAKPAEPVRQTISPTTSATMRQMLYGTRNSRRLNGTDRAGYFVGGKTGTSQAIRDGAYVMDQTLATYVGFGGAGDGSQIPEYVIMVKIWEEGKKIEGEKDALPIFDLLSNYMQDYLQIQPAL